MDAAYDQEEPEQTVFRPSPRPKTAPAAGQGESAGGMFDAFAKNKAFQDLLRATVLEVLRSPEGQELLILVTELTINYYAATFISRYGCDAYFTHNQELLFYERQQEIISQLESLELN